MKHRVFCMLTSIVLILCLSSCQTAQNNSTVGTRPAESQQPVNTTPIVSASGIVGVWKGGQNSSGTHTEYLYFSSSGEVYWMGKKSGTPSTSEFTSDYRIASSYSISVNNAGDTICSFGSWTATFSSSNSMYVSGKTIGGTYRK